MRSFCFRHCRNTNIVTNERNESDESSLVFDFDFHMNCVMFARIATHKHLGSIRCFAVRFLFADTQSERENRNENISHDTNFVVFFRSVDTFLLLSMSRNWPKRNRKLLHRGPTVFFNLNEISFICFVDDAIEGNVCTFVQFRFFIKKEEERRKSSWGCRRQLSPLCGRQLLRQNLNKAKRKREKRNIRKCVGVKRNFSRLTFPTALDTVCRKFLFFFLSRFHRQHKN